VDLYSRAAKRLEVALRRRGDSGHWVPPNEMPERRAYGDRMA
jgi:hypothetical protein